MGKTYTITGPQLRSIIKDAFFAGFDAARKPVKADEWESSQIRRDVDFHGLFERLEQYAKDMVTR